MAERPPEILLVRHGETDWSRDGRHTGRTDIPLTATGRDQAELLGRRLGRRRFTRVLTSPFQRALETCRRAGLGASAQVRPELAEWDYGAYEGRRTVDIRAERPRWSLWRDGAPGGEAADDVGARVDPVVAELRSATGDVAVFAHGHVLRIPHRPLAGAGAERGAPVRAGHDDPLRSRLRAGDAGHRPLESGRRGVGGLLLGGICAHPHIPPLAEPPSRCTRQTPPEMEHPR